ncbi:alpha-galactosidase [Microbacterium esteraromaticum]|uniref:alpha-galactosidase n=1 Tax=Microbacterium esteraromaticum TaxID=57043 RepID=UPI001A8DB563|nr:alpha-galactosidase [Microbacterium esteraromaticum]MBN8424958.1 alpha-galactosidase [Microbacterium esteraromaticum]
MVIPDSVHLRADGVSVFVDFADAAPAAILHWGADLGALSAGDAETLRLLATPGIGPSVADKSIRVGVLPELSTGWMGHPGITLHQQGRGWSPSLRTVAVSIGGAPAPTGHVESGPTGVHVMMRSEDTGVLVALELELDASGILRVRTTISNESAGAAVSLDGLTMALPVPIDADEALDFAGHWGFERAPQRHRIPIGRHVRENRRGRTGHDAATIMIAGRPGFGFRDGEVWSAHVGWSGNHVHAIERAGNGAQLLTGGELLLPGEVLLGRGDSYVSPWMYGIYGDGLDAAAGRMHRSLRSRPQHPTAPRPVILNVWEAVYFDHDEHRLIELAAIAGEVGVERFVLDDGWFRGRRNDHAGLGDWTHDTTVWPDGLGPLVEAVHAHGMEFGLWVEPEMVNLDSELVRAHPDWILQARSELPIVGRHQYVLDLSRPEAYDYIKDAMIQLLSDYPIDYLKWDHNRDLLEAGSSVDGTPAVHRQTAAVYRLLDELRAAHPGLEIEACASGGARVDLGILEHSDRVWASDNHDALDRQHIQRWTAQLLPGELVGAHIGRDQSSTTGRIQTLDFRAITALFGHFGVEWDLGAVPPQQLDELRVWIERYKRYRALVHAGTTIRIDTNDPSRLIHGVVAPDRAEALFAIVALTQAVAAPVGRYTLRGLSSSKRYRVRIVSAPAFTAHKHNVQWVKTAADPGRTLVVSGAVLTGSGIELPNLQPQSAVLLHLEEA